MNTLRRNSKIMIRAFAAMVTMVAVGLPLAGIAGASGSTFALTESSSQGTSDENFAVFEQGTYPSAGNTDYNLASGFTTIDFDGTDFANNQAEGGSVTLATNAPGVTFANVVEDNAFEGSAYIDVPATTPAGYYSLTLTDGNGTSTLTAGLAIDAGPVVTSVSGNTGVAGGTASSVKIVGSGVNDGTGIGWLDEAWIEQTSTTSAVLGLGTVVSNDGSTETVTVPNASDALPAGSYTLVVATDDGSDNVDGLTSVPFTVTAPSVAAGPTITGISPSELLPPTTNSTTFPVTITGTDFLAGATLTPLTSAGATVSGVVNGVSFGSATLVNSTTFTVPVTVVAGASTAQFGFKVTNLDATTSGTTYDKILGINEAGAAITPGSTPSSPVPAEIFQSEPYGNLIPGSTSILTVTGSSTFPLTTSSVIKVSDGATTNPSSIFTGTVLSVDSGNDATVQVNLPAYESTTLSAATLTGAVTLPVTDASSLVDAGITTAWIVDGANTEQVTISASSKTSLTVGATAHAHASGVVVEWATPPSSALAHGYVATATAGNLTSSANGVGASAATAPSASVAGVAPVTLTPFTSATPGTYTLTVNAPGFGFTTGAAVTFGGAGSGITGTVTKTTSGSATITVTIPAVGSVSALGTTAAAVSPGAITLATVAAVPSYVVAGDTIAIAANTYSAQTATVLSVGTNSITFTAPLTYAVGAGATLTDSTNGPGTAQATTGTVTALVTNGAGLALTLNAFSLGAIVTTATIPNVGSGAQGALDPAPAANAASWTLSHALLDGVSAAGWTATSTNPAVTLSGVSVTGTTLTAAVTVAFGTPATANVPVVFTDGVNYIAAKLNVVAAPTLTAVTSVGTLQAGGLETIGVNGTGFTAAEYVAFFANGTAQDPAITVNGTGPNYTTSEPFAPVSSTGLTLTNVHVGAGALNGTDTLGVVDLVTGGVAILPGALIVTGQPTATKISPATISQDSTDAFTVTGTGFTTTSPSVLGFTELVNGALPSNPTVTADSPTVTVSSATSLSFSDSFLSDFDAGQYEFEISDHGSTFWTPAVTVVGQPEIDRFTTAIAGGEYNEDYEIALGSQNVPFKIYGELFEKGATVSITNLSGTSIGTATVNTVTDNLITGTLSLTGGVQNTTNDVTVTNPDGGVETDDVLYILDTGDVPTVTSVAGNVGGTLYALSGTTGTWTVTGTNFGGSAATAILPTLTTSPSGDVTFGTPVWVSSTTFTVPVTYIGFTGITPLTGTVVATFPTGFGSESNVLPFVVDAEPAVTGAYYVPTFATNVEVTVTGSGFEPGLTVTSANADYKVTLGSVNALGTSVTLLVTTDATATAGTSSSITFKNPDGGSVSFALNGGAAPSTTAKPSFSKITGSGTAGKTTTITLTGKNLHRPTSVKSSSPGSKVTIVSVSATKLVLHLTTKKGTPRKVYTLTIKFAGGVTKTAKYVG
jgi:fibronectin-binding autotransporter adhesin